MGGWNHSDAEAMAALQHSIDRLRDGPVSISRLLPRPRREMTAYVRVMISVYRAALQISGARAIVDTSKYPGYAATLNKHPDVDLRVIHLIRDSRAMAHSWTRPLREPQHMLSGNPCVLNTSGFASKPTRTGANP
jgi:hypothetical protein